LIAQTKRSFNDTKIFNVTKSQTFFNFRRRKLNFIFSNSEFNYSEYHVVRAAS